MTAAITDLLKKTYNAANPNVARVTATRAISGTTLTCDNLAGWPTDTAVSFSTYKVNASNVVVAGTQIDWVGLVAGNNVGTLTRITGAADGGSAIGDVVEMNPTANWANDLVTNILTHANQNGTLKDGSVSSTTIASGAITSTNIATNGVSGTNIQTNAITLGKNTSFTSFSTTSLSDVQATGATLTVTVPPGGRDVEVILDNVVVTNTVGIQYVSLSLWEGAVVSGTLLSRKYWVIPNSGGIEGISLSAQHTPSSGSHTYNVGVQVQSGTGGYNTYAGQILKARLV